MTCEGAEDEEASAAAGVRDQICGFMSVCLSRRGSEDLEIGKWRNQQDVRAADMRQKQQRERERERERERKRERERDQRY